MPRSSDTPDTRLIRKPFLEVDSAVSATSAGAMSVRDEVPRQTLPKFLIHKILSKVKY